MKTPVSPFVILTVFLVLSQGCGGENTVGGRNGITQPPGAPVVESLALTVGVGDSVTAQLVATDPEEQALTFSLAQAPEAGEVILDSATGALSYTAGFEEGEDSFRVSVSDGEHSTKTTVLVTIEGFNYTGRFKVGQVGGHQGCPESLDINIIHRDGRFFVQSRLVTCSITSGNTTLRWGPYGPTIDVEQQGDQLYLEDEVVGTISSSFVEVTVPQQFYSCTAEATFTLERNEDGLWSWRDRAQGCNGASVYGQANYVRTVNILAVSTGHAGAVAADSTLSFDFVVQNVGKIDAEGVEATDPGAPFAFVGGAFPGTNADCTIPIPSNATCRMTLEVSPEQPGKVSGHFYVTYSSGDGDESSSFSLVVQAHPTLNSPQEVAVGESIVCVRDADGVKCWGRAMDSEEVPALSNPTQIAVGGAFGCALDDTGVVCWPASSPTANVPALNAPSRISAGGNHACTIDGNDVTCWGSIRYSLYGTRTYDTPTNIIGGARHQCVVDNAGLSCFGEASGTIPTFTDLQALSAGSGVTCAVDAGTIVCWAIYDTNPVLRHPLMSDAVGIEVGYNGACAVDGLGSMVCWGEGVNAPPEGMSAPSSLGLANYAACAVADGDLVCW